MRRSLLLGLVCLAASASAQVRPDAGRDLLTAEPFLFATDAEALATPPDESAALMGGLAPVAHLASGSTKLVRRLGEMRVMYQDGSDLVVARVNPTPMPGGGKEVINETGRYRLDAQPADAVVVGTRAYVALRKNQGVLILDVGGDAPTFVGQVTGVDALAVAVSGMTLYVGRGAAGVSAYALSNPSAPELIGTVDTPGSANGLAVSGTLLAVADGNVSDGPDVRLYDVAAPGTFALVGTAEANGFATYVAFHAGRLYATGDAGLLAYDVSNPAAPVLLGTAAEAGTAYEVAFSGSTAYVAGLAGLRVVDVSAPVPVETGAFDPGGQGLSVAHVTSSLVLLADRFFGARLVDDAAPPGPIQIAFARTGGFSFRGTFDARGYLYVTDLAGGLRIIDTRALGTAAEIARVDLPGNTQEVLVVEQPAGTFRAFVTDADGPDSGLSVVDVTDPATPTLVGTVAVGPGYGMATDEFGEALFVASGFAGLRSYDVAGATPVLLDTYDVGANAVDVASDNDGGFGYVATFGGGMTVIYIADPANLSLLSAQTGWGFLNAVEVDPGVPNGSRLLAADGQSGLRLVDATNAANLATYSLHPTASQARDVAGRDGLGFTYVYVAEDFTGMRRFRVDALTNEVSLAGTFISADRGIGVTVRPGGPSPEDDRTIALMAGEAGVYLFDGGYVLPSTEPGAASARLAIEAVWPNPARAAARLRYRLDAPGDATVEVLDVLGRRVAVAADGVHAAGTHTATVDARPLAPGVYVVRLTQGESMATARLVVGR